MRRVVGTFVVALALALPAVGLAGTPACQNLPLPDRLDASHVAFLGRLLSHEGTAWTFAVDQSVKGDLGDTVVLHASELTDATGKTLVPAVEVGVMAMRDGSELATDSCSLAEPSALVTVADDKKGGLIKIVIGLVLLAAVLQWSSRRRRRGTRPNLPGAPTA